MQRNRDRPGFIWAAVAGAVIGAWIGYRLGRAVAPACETALRELTRALADAHDFNSAAPIISAAIVSGCAMITGTVIPLVMCWFLKTKEN